MTNGDYIRMHLNDNLLSKICTFCGTIKFEDGILYDTYKVFEYWSSKEYTVPSKNFYENVEELKANASTLGYFDRFYLRDTDRWVKYGRTEQQGMNLFLSLQHNQEYWDKAIRSYNEKWSK